MDTPTMKIYILDGGKSSRFGFPKKNIDINGENIICRILRQVHEQRTEAYVLMRSGTVAGDSILRVILGLLHKDYNPMRNIFLFGDVVYSDRVMRDILHEKCTCVYGREAHNYYSGKHNPERYALVVEDEKIEFIRGAIASLIPYEYSQCLTLCLLKDTARIKYVLTKDFTDDIDTPAEYDMFKERIIGKEFFR